MTEVLLPPVQPMPEQAAPMLEPAGLHDPEALLNEVNQIQAEPEQDKNWATFASEPQPSKPLPGNLGTPK